MNKYMAFLNRKVAIAPESGFVVKSEDINPALKPHQRDAVIWACKGGRRAIFESFGLGKTVQELEFCRLVLKHEGGGKALIVLPLGVRQEFYNDAVNILGMEKPRYVTTTEEAISESDGILLTNYERVRDGGIDPKIFKAVCLDEAAVLRSFGSKTYQTFLPLFKGIKYKLVATATPSPNRIKELIHYAGFLEVMDTGQALTRFFQRDSTKANNLTLYPHKVDEFWLWVSSWALYIGKPSDLGYDDTGYNLPPYDVRVHVVKDDKTVIEDKDGSFKMMNDVAESLSEASHEKNESIKARVAKAKEIMAEDPDSHYILWHDLEAERAEIKKQIPDAVDIYGTMDYDEREKRVIDFSFGKTKVFATKKSLSGCGCNFQRYCHRAIFVGIDYQFHDFIQAIHRIYRFLQTEKVIIDIIHTESEKPIFDALMAKWRQHDDMQKRMGDIVRKYGLHHKEQIERMMRSIGVKRVEIKGQHFTAVNNDCVEETGRMEDNSIDLIVTSIPFSNHYEYTPSYNDFGHNEDNDKFFEQMDFLTPNLLRILKPGRLACVHVKDRILFGNATGTGMPTVDPFSDMTVMHYIRHGFQYMGRICVLTDVVRENNQTYRLGWTEQCKDGTKMGVGCPEYILLFRKLPTDTGKAYADEPVKKSKEEYTRAQWQIDAHSFWRSSGDRLPTKEEVMSAPVNRLQDIYRRYSRGTVYSYDEHVAEAKRLDEDGHLPATFIVVAPGSWSESIWDDINRMKTLNTTQSQRRQTMHVCPLQLDIVDRLINRYSNPGDLVLDPFGGLGTVALEAIKAGRRGYTIELNDGYFRDAVGYLESEEESIEAPTMFDLFA